MTAGEEEKMFFGRAEKGFTAMAGGEWRLIIFQGFWPRHWAAAATKVSNTWPRREALLLAMS